MSEPSPARVVADADALAADLLVGGPAREALDHVRSHGWMELVASDELLGETEAVIAALADDDLASAWRERIEAKRVAVSHPPEDHPALASAYRGGAAHLLSFDETLTSAATNRSLQSRVSLSVRTPDAFAALFDPESLYESLHEDPYPGPDRDPRA
jgi:predicted nucleic acid-binding protein